MITQKDSDRTVGTLLSSFPEVVPVYFDLSRLLGLAPWKKSCDQLDSILKRRDITLPTKVRLVKATVFPVVMYGCESWTIKKAERRRMDAFELQH